MAKKKPGDKRLVSETDFGRESSETDEQSDEEDEDENEMLENILQNTTSMTHPVIYLDINLCEKRTKIGKYREKKLKAMVEALDLVPEETDKKILVECLKQYFQQLS